MKSGHQAEARVGAMFHHGARRSDDPIFGGLAIVRNECHCLGVLG